MGKRSGGEKGGGKRSEGRGKEEMDEGGEGSESMREKEGCGCAHLCCVARRSGIVSLNTNRDHVRDAMPSSSQCRYYICFAHWP